MSYDYKGPEIISELVISTKWKGKGKIKQNQKILVRCFKCENIKEVYYRSHVYNRLKSPYPEYMCGQCVKSHMMRQRNLDNFGISYEEKYGKEKADLMKKVKRKYAIDNKLSERFIPYSKMSWDELYGKEKADIMRENHRKKCKLKPKYGEDNPQWGKPAHKLSGKGIKGYYNGSYFRSLMEASFIIKYLEPNNIIFENGELKKYSIPYIYEGNPRNYFCDFVADGVFYEIKPKALHKNIKNIAKWDAAKIWCGERGYEFKIFSEFDYDKLTQEEIDNLIKDGKLVLI